MTLRNLRPADIPDAMRLKEAAGWNQTEGDWRTLLELAPDGCFGIEADGHIAATATAVCYGRDLGWIGMVLTAPEFRGRGFARRLMERVIEYVDSRGVEWSKLDGTDMGVPLYRQLGYVDECAIERWRRPAGPAGFASEAPTGAFDRTLDREAFGADRAALLDRLAFESRAIAGCGYALGRPGSCAAYFGPCVAESAETARVLLEAFLTRHAGEDVYWDLLPSNGAAAALARAHGFSPLRRLIRAARPGPSASLPAPRAASSVFAIAGFEFG